MARADKVAAVAELTESFRTATAAVLTEYRGLTVAELKELRRAIAADAKYAVVKNTLTKLAVRDAGVAELEPLLEGPSAIAFVTGDPINVAKGIRDFAKTHPALVVKGGVFDGRPVTADDLRKLADLESREVLLAKLAGGMLAPAQQLASVLQNAVAQLARALGALEAKATADPSILGGGAGTPVAEAPTEEAAAEPAVEETAAAEAPTEEAAAAPAVEETAAAEADAEPAAAETPAAETSGPAEMPSDGTPGVQETPDTSAAADPGEQAQTVADATDVAPGSNEEDASTESTS
jgi:large subunit ribosomal protein L10